MPSVPPQCIPRSTSEEAAAAASGVLSSGIASCPSPGASPTPDPDLDDIEMVPVVTGDGVGVVSSTHKVKSLNHARPKFITLDGVSLHSPSELVGTPFDVTAPRYEYPFPSPQSELADNISPLSPVSSFSTSMIHTHFSSSYISAAPTISLSNPMPLNSSHRSSYHSHTSHSHLKLQASIKEPPMPPGLANKRWSNPNNKITSTPARPQARTRSSSDAAPQVVPQNDSSQKMGEGRSVSAERPSNSPRPKDNGSLSSA